MLDPTSDFRARFSAATSIILAIIFFGLPYVPPSFEWIRWVSILILLIDAVVKFFNVLEFREYVSAAYSMTMAISSLTFFKILGTPLSEAVAVLWMIDAIFKILPGSQQIFGVDEYIFRHYFSAITTTITGLSTMFGIALFGSITYGFIAGLIILIDGVIKLEYANIL